VFPGLVGTFHNPWWFTEVYGPQIDAEKIEFLEELRVIRNRCQGPIIEKRCQGPWFLAGDFNLILDSRDKKMITLTGP
jgi:hypothetical protein